MSDQAAATAQAKDPQGLGDSRAQAQRLHGGAGQARAAREARAEALAHRRCSGRAEQVAEHCVPIAAVVVAPRKLVQVALMTALATD